MKNTKTTAANKSRKILEPCFIKAAKMIRDYKLRMDKVKIKQVAIPNDPHNTIFEMRFDKDEKLTISNYKKSRLYR